MRDVEGHGAHTPPGNRGVEQRILRSIQEHLPGEGARVNAVRGRLADALVDFVGSGLADSKFVDELRQGERKFWAGVSEALVAARLHSKEFPRRSIGKGPDFLVMDGASRVWIEVVCPEPMGVPGEWTRPEPNVVHTFPHEEILLRWTAAIQQKVGKLIGDEENPGYLGKGIVAYDDAYVIAVNACRLRSGPFSYLEGISGFPFALEAVFPVGPRELTLDVNSMRTVGQGHAYRPFVVKANGSRVEALTFLDPRSSAVSAIWALDLDGGSAIGNREPSAVIHNPLAKNPVARGFLPADEEYVATRDGDVFVVTKDSVTEAQA